MPIENKASGFDSYRSDRQRTGGMTATAGSDTGGTNRGFTDKASDTAHDLAHKTKMAGDKLKDKAEDVGDSLKEGGRDISKKAQNAYEQICDFTTENPTAAVLIAFGLGAILARILPGR